MDMFNQPITGDESITDDSLPYAALVRFYTAFNRRDALLMEDNWLKTDAAVMSNPLGGVKRGWQQIRDVYETIFNGPAKVYVEFYDYSIYTTPDMFCAVGRERGRLHMSDDVVELAIRTSRIYSRYQGGWKQVHHHGSMDNPQLLMKYQNLLLNK